MKRIESVLGRQWQEVQTMVKIIIIQEIGSIPMNGHISDKPVIFLIYKVVSCGHMLHEKYDQLTKFLVFICLSVAIVAGLSSGAYFSSASAQNKTAMEPTGMKNTIGINSNICPTE